MKTVLSICFILLSVISVSAQTPIDALQNGNVAYLASLENEGYEFRSQIITEFDAQHASQSVNIKLSEGYNYVIVALGDSNIPQVNLEIKPVKKAKVEDMPLENGLSGLAYQVSPTSSGRFKISINVNGFNESDKGFVSFMVLRK